MHYKYKYKYKYTHANNLHRTTTAAIQSPHSDDTYNTHSTHTKIRRTASHFYSHTPSLSLPADTPPMRASRQRKAGQCALPPPPPPLSSLTTVTRTCNLAPSLRDVEITWGA
jgi:hypothetical protein